MSDYIIRELKPEELVEAVKVFLQSFGYRFESAENIKKFWEKSLKSNMAKFITAEESGKLIGVVGLFFVDPIATVGNMSVLQEYRGKGIGKAIFRAIMELATSLNYESIGLYASELGEHLYRKFGFQGEHYVRKYQIISNKTKIKIQDDKITIVEHLPNWVIDLDKISVGIDRTKYFRIQLELGAKLIVLEDKGFGFYHNGKIGPVIAQGAETAIDIIKKSILLGADHLITSKLGVLSKNLPNAIKLDQGGNQPNRKMYYGIRVPQNLNYIYALSSFAIG
ncbi:hypothetical protein LCGC14_1157810 [marine sediment metagenome]|uniref:N-acetyltransferase domain-containing protein n=1 Tax=marine sediment metagenome TaxID=412755 RepID=A0A0F9LTM1_9ZZZZ